MVRTHGDDEHEQRVIDDVQRVGWHMIGIDADAEGPGFVYSIGLYHIFEQPEIIIFGLKSTEAMFQVVNRIGDDIRSGNSFEDWHENDQILTGCSCMFRNVERGRYPDFLGYAIWYYEGSDFPVLQCVWPDESGRYPWEPEFPLPLKEQQPVLTDRSAWFFREGKNRAVFTTRPVIEERLPILLVSHDAEGDWQFLCGTTNRSEDGRIVCLKDIVERSPSILELADLPIGWQAIRESPDRPWQRLRNKL